MVTRPKDVMPIYAHISNLDREIGGRTLRKNIGTNLFGVFALISLPFAFYNLYHAATTGQGDITAATINTIANFGMFGSSVYSLYQGSVMRRLESERQAFIAVKDSI